MPVMRYALWQRGLEMSSSVSDKTIVVSAINIFTAGPLTIARDFLSAVGDSPRFCNGEYRLIFFCHSAKAYADILDAIAASGANSSVEVIEKPLSRKNWVFRIYYEYIYFWLWSLRNPVDTWLSLHDMTPNVRARRRIVYCQNAAPFYEGSSAKIWREPRFEIFRRFYSLLYRINLHKNQYVIVQQQWLRQAFVARFGCDPQKVIVANPNRILADVPKNTAARVKSSETLLVYAAFPRFFKNFEVLLDAMRLLIDLPVRLVLTVNGTENKYAAGLLTQYGNLSNVQFGGYLSFQQMNDLYAAADALVFPSTLESWGLPLSEFRAYQKPIFAADLPYAKEVLSGYAHARFFDPHDSQALADSLRQFITLR